MWRWEQAQLSRMCVECVCVQPGGHLEVLNRYNVFLAVHLSLNLTDNIRKLLQTVCLSCSHMLLFFYTASLFRMSTLYFFLLLLFVLLWEEMHVLQSIIWEKVDPDGAQPTSIIGISSWMCRGLNAYMPRKRKPFLSLIGKECTSTSFQIFCSRLALSVEDSVALENINAALQNFLR